MSQVNTWIKPNGVKVQVNDHPANEAHARALKWKKEGEPSPNDSPKQAEPKRG